MTAEETEKQKNAERAANKARYTRLAEFYKNEAAHYLKKADDCDEIVLAPSASAGKYGGL
jgi:hypothetical protein